jgi:hypothetical protein
MEYVIHKAKMAEQNIYLEAVVQENIMALFKQGRLSNGAKQV